MDYLEDQNLIRVDVRDDGVGMDEEELARLNELLDGSYNSEKISKNSSGFGLGLTIAQAILIEISPAQYPCFTIVSSKHKGTHICFYLRNLINNETESIPIVSKNTGEGIANTNKGCLSIYDSKDLFKRAARKRRSMKSNTVIVGMGNDSDKINNELSHLR